MKFYSCFPCFDNNNLSLQTPRCLKDIKREIGNLDKEYDECNQILGQGNLDGFGKALLNLNPSHSQDQSILKKTINNECISYFLGLPRLCPAKVLGESRRQNENRNCGVLVSGKHLSIVSLLLSPSTPPRCSTAASFETKIRPEAQDGSGTIFGQNWPADIMVSFLI